MIINNLVKDLQSIDQKQFDKPDYNRCENIHRLFLYPAMMVPATQKVIIEIIAKYLPKNCNMIDPFMGSSTSILSCMEVGFNAYGQDINPLAVLLSKVKTGPLDYVLFDDKFKVLFNLIKSDHSEDIAVDFPGINKWFKKNNQIELSRLRRCIMAEDNIDVRRFFWIVLAETIRVSSNDRTSTYKLHQRSIDDIENRSISAIEEFLKLCKRSIEDIKLFSLKLNNSSLLSNTKYNGEVEVRWGNSMKSIDTNLNFDLLVSSPPYGDNHTTVTYGQHSFLELQWIDHNDIDENIGYDYLRTTQEIDRQSLGGRINSKEINEKRDKLCLKSKSLKEFIYNCSQEEIEKTDKIISFIDDFDKSIDVIIPKLQKGAFLVWTIGNRNVAKREVPNDLILIDLMKVRNISLIHQVERIIQNKKMPKRNKTSKTMDKEKILIFQKVLENGE